MYVTESYSGRCICENINHKDFIWKYVIHNKPGQIDIAYDNFVCRRALTIL